MQKVPKRKFPYEYEPSDTPVESLAQQDLDKIKTLKDDKDKLRSFINDRMANYELDPRIRPGLPTRDYLNALTGESVLRNDPELAKIAEEQGSPELGKAVRSKMFPDLDKALQAHNMSTDVEAGEDLTSGSGKMSLKRTANKAANVGNAIHENAHLLDFLAYKHSKDKFVEKNKGAPVSKERMSTIQKFLKSKPAAIPLFTDKPDSYPIFEKRTTEDESINRYGEEPSNPRVYNFSDYSFPEGEFKSDMIRTPLDVQDESGEAHHIDRNQTYDNMIKSIEDNGRMDRLTKTDRFKKLRTLVS